MACEDTTAVNWKYDEQIEEADRKLAESHPDVWKLDRHTALTMTRVDGIHIDEWVARASHRLSQ